jgi:hypothetical protein
MYYYLKNIILCDEYSVRPVNLNIYRDTSKKPILNGFITVVLSFPLR